MIPQIDLKNRFVRFIEIHPAYKPVIPFLSALFILIVDAVIREFYDNSLIGVILLIAYSILGILTLIPIVNSHFSARKITLFIGGSVLAILYWFFYIVGCAGGNCLPPIFEPYMLYNPLIGQILTPFILFYVVTLFIGAIIFGFFFILQQTFKNLHNPIIPVIICILLLIVTFNFPEPFGAGYFAVVFFWVFQKLISKKIFVLMQMTIILLLTISFVMLANTTRLVNIIHFGNTWLFIIPVVAAIILSISWIFAGQQTIKNLDLVIFFSSVVSVFIISLIYPGPSGSIGTVFENIFAQASGQFLYELSRLFLLEVVMAVCSAIVFYMIFLIFQRWKWPRISR